MEEIRMNQSLIKVLIVDDHPVVRDGLKLMLSVSPGLSCIGQAENGEEALQLCDELKPDVILMDLMMPVMDGVSATRIIQKKYPNIQVVALTTFDDKELVQKALRAGAISYMLKNASMETITNTIREAYAGRPTLSKAAIQSLIEAKENDLPDQELRLREKEILLLMADGLKNATIAEKLYISEATVRFHVSNILRKLGATNRAQAVRIAFDRGLIH
jgi:two-component system, NarL family, response regulator LiaR